jgi:amino acid transporter
MRFYASANAYPELAGIPERYRVPLTLRCHRYFASSGWNRRFQPVFFVCTIVAVLSGVAVGFLRGSVWAMLAAVTVVVFLETFAFSVVSQIVIRRRLKAYLQTDDCREFLRESGL